MLGPDSLSPGTHTQGDDSGPQCNIHATSRGCDAAQRIM